MLYMYVYNIKFNDHNLILVIVCNESLFMN